MLVFVRRGLRVLRGGAGRAVVRVVLPLFLFCVSGRVGWVVCERREEESRGEREDLYDASFFQVEYKRRAGQERSKG